MIIQVGARWINLDQVTYVKDQTWKDKDDEIIVEMDIHFNGDCQLNLRGDDAEALAVMLENIEEKVVIR